MKTKLLWLAVGVFLAVLMGQIGGRSDKRVVTSPDFPELLGPYSHAVTASGFVFVAGQAPINPKTQQLELGDVRTETGLELTNIAAMLKAASSSIENVVKVSVHLADLNDFEAINEVYR